VTAGRAIRDAFFTVVSLASTAGFVINGSPVTGEMVRSVPAFMGSYLGVCVVSVGIVSLTGADPATAMSAAATAMGGVGPGLGAIGPVDDFLWMAPAARLVLTFDMFAGRLELVTLMVRLTPAFRRR